MDSPSRPDLPIATFRRRKRPLRRLAWEAGAGVLLATVAYFLPLLYQWEAWASITFLMTVSAGIVFGLVRTFRTRWDAISLYADRLVWRDYRGRRKEASYAQIIDIEPDRHQHRHFVRVQGAGGFWISPQTERFTEIWRRLREPQVVREPLPRGREQWEAGHSYGPKASLLTASLTGIVGSGILLFVSFNEPSALFFLSIVGALVSFQLLLAVLFERIEIEGDEIIHHSWVPGIHRRIPLSCIVGACLYDGKDQRFAAIDTDYGEIRFSASFDGAESLVREAERLGAARYERAAILRREEP